MANVCVIRHQSYIKSQTHLPYRHNMRTLKHYSNENIDLSLTKFNSIIENNLNIGESYLTAFNRLHRNRAFTGQLKVQGDELKQTKYLDEFLVYPPYEKIKEMSFSEQDEFFRKEIKAIKNYFPDVIILSAVVHRDEVFLPMDEDMKSLFPEGKITPWYYVKKKYKLNVNFFNNIRYHYTAFNSISFNALQCSLSYSFGDRYPQ